MVVAVLFSAGDQVPVILFSDVVGNAFNVPPEQIGAIALKVGVIFGFAVTVPLAGADAHVVAGSVIVTV